MPMRPPAGFISAFYDPLNNPNAPTSPAATAGDATAAVTFVAPSNVGGSAITGYGAISTPGDVTATASASPISVTGLTNGTAYTFAVWAINTYGPSAFSAASGSVTPAALNAYFMGGSGSQNTIAYVSISTTGNASDWGDLIKTRDFLAVCSSATRAVISGFSFSGVNSNVIDKLSLASAGNSSDFGDLTRASLWGQAACSNGTRGVLTLGYNSTPEFTNVMEYVTIATDGNATNFGDLLNADTGVAAGCASPTRGIIAGGSLSSKLNVIQYITIASAGNATDFGDLTIKVNGLAGFSSSTRGVFGGGDSSPDVSYENTISYITIASTGNATDFGDLTQGRRYLGGASSTTRGLFGGGESPTTNTIDYVTIASASNATDFGDLTVIVKGDVGCSNCHGGLS